MKKLILFIMCIIHNCNGMMATSDELYKYVLHSFLCNDAAQLNLLYQESNRKNPIRSQRPPREPKILFKEILSTLHHLRDQQEEGSLSVYRPTKQDLVNEFGMNAYMTVYRYLTLEKAFSLIEQGKKLSLTLLRMCFSTHLSSSMFCGTTALVHAYRCNKPKIITLLLERDHDIFSTHDRWEIERDMLFDCYDEKLPQTDNHCKNALEKGLFEHLKTVINHKDMPRIQKMWLACKNIFTMRDTTTSNSLLHLVAFVEGDCDDIANYLIERGVDVNGRNDFGATPLSMAIERSNVKYVQRLLKAGAKVDDIILYGLNQSLLDYPVSHGKTEIVKALLDHGIRVSKAYSQLTDKSHGILQHTSYTDICTPYPHDDISIMLKQAYKKQKACKRRALALLKFPVEQHKDYMIKMITDRSM